MVHDKRTRNSLEINWNEVRNRLNQLDPEFNFIKKAIETPSLSPEEETELAIRMEEGDEKAKQRLIESNIRLVALLALQKCKDPSDLQDAFQEGSLGLIRAVENYDYQKGFRLEKHAIWWISHYIASGKKHCCPESTLSVERLLRQGKEELLTAKTVEMDPGETTSDKVKRKFLEVMDELSDLERVITYFLYGLNGDKPLSVKKISEKLEISMYRVVFTDEKVTHRLQQKMVEKREETD